MDDHLSPPAGTMGRNLRAYHGWPYGTGPDPVGATPADLAAARVALGLGTEREPMCYWCELPQSAIPLDDWDPETGLPSVMPITWKPTTTAVETTEPTTPKLSTEERLQWPR